MGTLVWYIWCLPLIASYSDLVVRLVDGPDFTEGRIEMFFNNAWGAICDVGFDDIDAQVACNSLGFNAGQGSFIGNTHGPGTGDIVFSDVECNGTEYHIDECSHTDWYVPDDSCTHNNDVSISCVGTGYPMRLAGSSTGYDGRLEIYYRDEWGSVGDYNFDETDTRVACFSLGFGRTGSLIVNIFGLGTGVQWLEDIECVGDEANIGYCEHYVWGSAYSADVAISCYNNDYAVRLADGPDSTRGRLELYINGQWGSVCDVGFADSDAKVACYSLGFNAGEGVFIGNTYGAGSGPIHFSDVTCSGKRYHIDDCRHSPLGDPDGSCSHTNDVSVSCVGTGYPLRLVGSASGYDGRLEIYYQGTWGTVCSDGFDDNRDAARVACFSLGFGRIGHAIVNTFGDGTVPILLENVQCVGDEANIGYCAHLPWGNHNCQHSQDVAIECSNNDNELHQDEE